MTGFRVLAAKQVNHGQSKIWLAVDGKELTPHRILATNEVVNIIRRHTSDDLFKALYAVSSVTTGPHPMWFRRKELHRKGYLRAVDLEGCLDGSWVKTAGLAFVKQRPSTASGVVFIGVADETVDFRIFVAPDFFEQNRRAIQRAKSIGVKRPIQKEGPIIHAMARSIYELSAENQAGRLKFDIP